MNALELKDSIYSRRAVFPCEGQVIEYSRTCFICSRFLDRGYLIYYSGLPFKEAPGWLWSSFEYKDKKNMIVVCDSDICFNMVVLNARKYRE